MVSKDEYIVAIGASAGGLSPIVQFFEHLPAHTGVAYVVILHLPADYESKLEQILARHTTMQVHRIDQPHKAAADHIYVLPGKSELTVKEGILIPVPRATREVNRVIDKFFYSLAKDKREKAIGVIFSGTGCNGAKGVKEIHKNQGIVLVQNPLDAQFKDMPIAAINENHPSKIATPESLASNLMSIIYNAKVKKWLNDAND
jgi:chemotaxis response regulator CheB